MAKVKDILFGATEFFVEDIRMRWELTTEANATKPIRRKLFHAGIAIPGSIVIGMAAVIDVIKSPVAIPTAIVVGIANRRRGRNQ